MGTRKTSPLASGIESSSPDLIDEASVEMFGKYCTIAVVGEQGVGLQC